MTTSKIEDIERLNKIEELLLDLQDLSSRGVIIVVEGRKDVESLRELGINGEIKLASHQPLLEFTESLSKSEREIVILTDWDKKGEITAKKIIRHLQAYGIVPNTMMRSRLRALSQKRIKYVESLNKYVNKLRFEIHGLS